MQLDTVNPFLSPLSPVLELLKQAAPDNNVSAYPRPSVRDEVSLRPHQMVGLMPLLASSLFLPTLRSRSDFTAIVEALRSIHAGFQSNRRPYEEIHQTFHELEARLKDHLVALDRVLGHRAKPEKPTKAVLHALQQTIFLQCSRSGKTAGRFRCVNRTGKPAYVDFRTRSYGDVAAISGATLAFEPSVQNLAPDEAAIFRAVVDLSNCPQTPDETPELGANVYLMGADIHLNGELTLKLFISIEIYDEHG